MPVRRLSTLKSTNMQLNSGNLQSNQVPYASFQGAVPSPVGFNPVMVAEQRHRYSNYNTPVIKWLSITLIVLGGVCFIVQICDIALGDVMALGGSGIWAGIFFIMTGTIGLASCEKRSKCLIVSFLVTSIIGSLVAIGPIFFGSFGWASADYLHDNSTAVAAMNAILVFSGIICGILLIISSGFACNTICCSNEEPMRAGVIYPDQVSPSTRTTGQQQIIIIPSQQSLAGASYIPVLAPGANSIQGQQVPMNYPPQAGQLVYIQPSGTNVSAVVSQSAPPLVADGQREQPPPYSSLHQASDDGK